MQQIGVLIWMCELGWINICTEVFIMLSSFVAMPLQGHPEVALHVFSYLKSKSNSRLIFDPIKSLMWESLILLSVSGLTLPT
jgi:hypothetical protein